MNKSLWLSAFLFIFFLAQNTHAQSWKWATGSSCPGSMIESWAIGYDSVGNVYSGGVGYAGFSFDSVTAYFDTDTVVSNGLFLVSADSNGHYRWAIATTYASLNYLTADAAGNVYIFGQFADTFKLDTITITGGVNAAYCAKLNSSGRVLWMKCMGDSLDCTGNVDPSGNIVVAGMFRGRHLTFGGTTLTNVSPGLSDVFMVKLDPSGSPLWATSFGGSSAEDVIYTGVSTDTAGDIFLAGGYASSAITIGSTTLTNPTGTVPYGYIAKFNPSGANIWAKSIRFTLPYSSLLYGLAVDLWGNAYITGEFVGTVTLDTFAYTCGTLGQFYLARYDRLGNVKWATTINGSRYLMGYDITTDACGNVWNTGMLNSGIDGSYIFRYDTSGVLHDSLLLNIGGDDQIGIIADSHGNLYMGGDYYSDSAILGPDTLLLHGSQEALFMARYTYSLCSDEPLDEKPAANTPGEIKVYPNPANDELYIQSSTLVSHADIVDVTGRLLRSYFFDTKAAQIDISDLKPGVYLLRIVPKENSVTTRKIVISH